MWCWIRLLRVPWTPKRSNQSILKEISPECSLEGLILKLKLQYFGQLIQRTDSFAKTLILEKIEGGGEGDDRGWNCWMASLTQWTWVWIGSGSWWWTGTPGILQSMGSQMVRHCWVTELNNCCYLPELMFFPKCSVWQFSQLCEVYFTSWPWVLSGLSQHSLFSFHSAMEWRFQQASEPKGTQGLQAAGFHPWAWNGYLLQYSWASLVAQTVKNLPAVQETWVQCLGQKDTLEKGMATHYSILAFRIPWTEEPGRLQSTGSQRVGYSWPTEHSDIDYHVSQSIDF